MTHDEIVTEVTSTLNLTSSTASTRISRILNRTYKRVTSSLGIPEGTRISLTASASVSAAAQTAQFTSVEQVKRVWYLSGTRKVFLSLVSLDEIRDLQEPPTSDTPTRWAVLSFTDNDVTIITDVVANAGYTLKADCYATISTLATSNVPQFPESFHDLLVYGCLVVEYKKMGHKDELRDAKEDYRERLSDLRMWFAKQKYLNMKQHNEIAAVHMNRDGDSWNNWR